MHEIQVKTKSRIELIDITHEINKIVQRSGIIHGACIIFVPHTTAAVTINENADPSVIHDILNELNKIIPLQDDYRHMEGNSAAHIKSILIGCSQMVLVEQGALKLGTWQSLFFCEFDGPRNREVWVKVIQGN